jgi:tetratricopeptide (TPR) repeat protein
VTALGDTGAYEKALAVAEQAVASAESLDYPPVHAEALERLATVKQNLGDPKGAVELLDRAYFMARSNGHDRLAAEAAADLVWINGAYVGDVEASKRWAEHALADAERAGKGTELEATAKNGVGILYVSLNQADEAEPLLVRALELRRSAGEPLRIAQALQGVAMLDELRGKYARAIERYIEIRDIVIAEQGPGHPNVLYAISGLGTAEFSRGNIEAALGHYESGREIAVNALGAAHPRTVEMDENMALCFSELGENARAAEVLGRVLATMSKDDGPSYAQTSMNLGIILMRAEKVDDAVARLDDAVGGFEAALGPDSPWVAQALLARAEIDVKRDEPAAAIERLLRADAILAAAMPEHELRAKTLGLLAQAHALKGEFPAAVAAAEHAVKIAESTEIDPAMLEQLRKTLAGVKARKRR